MGRVPKFLVRVPKNLGTACYLVLFGVGQEMLWNVLECSRMLRKVLWVGGWWWVVSSNYSIISGPDLLNLRFEFELERSSETSRDDLELVWTQA